MTNIEINLDFEVDPRAPDTVESALEWMINGGARPAQLPAHGLFDLDSVDCMLRRGIFRSVISKEDSCPYVMVSIRSRVTAADLETFLEWVRPHCATRGLVGVARTMHCSIVLIYFLPWRVLYQWTQPPLEVLAWDSHDPAVIEKFEMKATVKGTERGP